MEQWKDIKDYEGYYQVSDYGNVKSLARAIIRKTGRKHSIRERILKPQLMTGGYYFVPFYKKNKQALKSIHQLVAINFISNPLQLLEINHKDGIKTNNYVENLEWCTRSYNNQHAYNIGLNKQGEKHPKTKHSDKKIIEVFNLLNAGETPKNISEKLNINAQYIRKLKRKLCRKQLLKNLGVL